MRVSLLGDVLGHVFGDVADGPFGVFAAGGDAPGIDTTEPQDVGRLRVRVGEPVDGGVPGGQRLACLRVHIGLLVVVPGRWFVHCVQCPVEGGPPDLVVGAGCDLAQQGARDGAAHGVVGVRGEPAASGPGAGVYRPVGAQRDGEQGGGPVGAAGPVGVHLADGAVLDREAGQGAGVLAAAGGAGPPPLVLGRGVVEVAAYALAGELLVDLVDGGVEVGDLVPLGGALGLVAFEGVGAAQRHQRPHFVGGGFGRGLGFVGQVPAFAQLLDA